MKEKTTFHKNALNVIFSHSLQRNPKVKKKENVFSPCTFFITGFRQSVDVNHPEIGPLRVGHH